MIAPKAVIFDLDGTLIDSAPDIQVATNVMLSELSRDLLDLRTIISFIGNGVEKLVERSLVATGGLPGDRGDSALERFKSCYSANAANLTQVYPGVIPCLERCQVQGIPMAVCTNKPTNPARNICTHLNLSPFLNVIRGAEDGKAKKPDPQPLLEAAAALGVPVADCLYVGDSETDYLTAKHANMPFVLFLGGYLKAPIRELAAEKTFDDWQTWHFPTSSRDTTLTEGCS